MGTEHLITGVVFESTHHGLVAKDRDIGYVGWAAYTRLNVQSKVCKTVVMIYRSEESKAGVGVKEEAAGGSKDQL